MVTSTSYTATVTRLYNEKKEIEKGDFQGFSIAPEEKDIFTWNGVIFGPEDSFYSGGTFKIRLKFGLQYPMEPPKCEFLTPIYHPNIFPDSGYICLNILQAEHWRPTMTVEKILISICSLLEKPNFDHYVVDSKTGNSVYHEPTQIGLDNLEQFKKTAKVWVRKYAE